VEIDANGFLHAIYDSGFTRTIYQIPVVDVPNMNGLISLDNQAFQVSANSGPVFLWDAGDGPTGEMVGFAREESATDVAAELTQLIQTQRAYSSNAKIIQTVALSLAEATDFPVEISDWVCCRFALTDFRVCSATMALLFVRMLDMGSVPFQVGRAFHANCMRDRPEWHGHRWMCHSDICDGAIRARARHRAWCQGTFRGKPLTTS